MKKLFKYKKIKSINKGLKQFTPERALKIGTGIVVLGTTVALTKKLLE